MSGLRLPGPICRMLEGTHLDLGTFCRMPAPRPGPLSAVPAPAARSETSRANASLLTVEVLRRIFPAASVDYLRNVAAELNVAPSRYGLDTPLRLAHFFAQVREESGPGLEATVESLQYSPDGLKIFGYYKRNPAEAVTDGYERDPRTRRTTRKANQELIANKAYANRNGNGDVASGDGWAFRGRGLIQVTGRDNYAATTKRYRSLYATSTVDFEKTPDLLAEFPYSVRSAVCYWINHGLQKQADRGATDADVDRITAVVNKATKSYEHRRANFRLAMKALST